MRILVGLLIFAMACGQEMPSRVVGNCVVETEHYFFRTPCLLEDLPAPDQGFNNRLRITLFKEEILVWTAQQPIADYVRVDALRDGRLRVSLILWGRLTIWPTDPSICQRFIEVAPSYEVRPQRLNIVRHGRFPAILIEEWQSDFNGRIPLPAWLADHARSMELFSRAK